MTRKTACFRRFRLVEFLHPVLAGVRLRTGFGLLEAIIAVTVFGVGVLGVAAVGGATVKLVHIAAVRSAQAVAAGSALESVPTSVGRYLDIAVDTTGVVPGLIEIHVTVGGSGSVGARRWVARRPSSGP
jgi:hypothetical protein